MNVFKLQPGTLTDINTQLIRLAPPGTKVCVIEVDEKDGRIEFAKEVATAIKTARQTQMVTLTVQGYRIGAIEANRTKDYHIWFIY